MIKSFKNKALAELFATGQSAKIDKRLARRITARLDALEQAEEIEDLNIPGNNFHGLRGFAPPRWTVHVNGPWCITFEFAEGDAFAVDLVQYH